MTSVGNLEIKGPVMTFGSLLTVWSFDPLVIFPLAAVALLYLRGVRTGHHVPSPVPSSVLLLTACASVRSRSLGSRSRNAALR
jgi:hypothetical protein